MIYGYLLHRNKISQIVSGKLSKHWVVRCLKCIHGIDFFYGNTKYPSIIFIQICNGVEKRTSVFIPPNKLILNVICLEMKSFVPIYSNWIGSVANEIVSSLTYSSFHLHLNVHLDRCTLFIWQWRLFQF